MGSENKALDKILQHTNSLTGLQGSLLSAANGETVRSLLVTSSRDHEGKSTVSTGLAAALARQAHAKVLLVDSNFRRPALANLFGLSTTPGLRSFLHGSPADQVVQQTSEPRLSLLATDVGESVADLSARLPERLGALYEKFDYVVFDGDSVLTSSEAVLLAQHVDGIVLVAECEQTKGEVLSLCIEKLARLGGRVLGVILNKRQYYIPEVFYEKL